MTKVVVVKFVSCGSGSTKRYEYQLMDGLIVGAGDTLLVEGKDPQSNYLDARYGIAVAVEVKDIPDHEGRLKMAFQVVDSTSLQDQREKDKKRKHIRNELKRLQKEAQDLIVWATLAEGNPEFQALLDELEELK